MEAKMARKKSSEDREEELLGRITMKMDKFRNITRKKIKKNS